MGRVILPIVNSDNGRRALWIYLVLTLALSSVLYFLIIQSKHLGAGGGVYVIILMWCPGTAAMLTCKVLGRDIASLGWKWGRPRYQVASFLIPLGYAAVTYAVVWLTGLGGLNRAFVKSFGMLFFLATVGLAINCVAALGEEIGWRGFLVPELAKRSSFTATALISGLIWAVWHYPILIFADYNAGTPTWYGLTCFTVMVVGMSFLYTWMRLKSGSLWTGVLLHASHNLFIQGFFDPLTTNTGRTKYVIGEFGAGLAMMCVLVGAYFWMRRGEASGSEGEAAGAGA
jgi:membrane protease YdiL (CAAX protease family)